MIQLLLRIAFATHNQASVPVAVDPVAVTRAGIELTCSIISDSKSREWLNVTFVNRGKSAKVVASPVYGIALFAQAVGSKDRYWYPLVESVGESGFILLQPGQSHIDQSPVSFFFRHNKGKGVIVRYDDGNANYYAARNGYARSESGSVNLGHMSMNQSGRAVWIQKVKKKREVPWLYPDIFGDNSYQCKIWDTPGGKTYSLHIRKLVEPVKVRQHLAGQDYAGIAYSTKDGAF